MADGSSDDPFNNGPILAHQCRSRAAAATSPQFAELIGEAAAQLTYRIACYQIGRTRGVGNSMKKFSDLLPDEIEQISKAIHSSQYYLLIGSGVNLDSSGKTEKIKSVQDFRDIIADYVTLPKTKTLQQVYSVLTKEEQIDFISKYFECVNVGLTIQKLAEYSWRRIYTFNVDDCFEKALEEIDGGSLKLFEDYQIFNFSDSYSDTNETILQSIVHLHGYVRRPDDGYVFSRQEYAKLMSIMNPWMATLSQIIKTEPFIISGTTLDEYDVEYYLSQRNQVFSRSDTPPSILIEPFPDKLTEKLCKDHDLILFDGYTEGFFNEIQKVGGKAPTYWLRANDDGLGSLSLSNRDRTTFGLSFISVPKNPSRDDRAAPFLLGGSLSWGALAGNADIPRKINSKLGAEIERGLRDPNSKVNIYLAEPGSGKTSILKRLAFEKAKIHKNVFYFSGEELCEATLAASILQSISGDTLVFFDNVADNYTYFVNLVSNTNKNNIIFIGMERFYRRPYIEDGLDNSYSVITEIKLDLERSESARLIRSFEDNGIASHGRFDEKKLLEYARTITGDTVAIAACKIQNNFTSFDLIVKGLRAATELPALLAYLTVGIARYCYSGGVERSILSSSLGWEGYGKLQSIYATLPLSYSEIGRSYIIPARSVVSERLLSIVSSEKASGLLDVFASLAKALAPKVNRHEISKRSPAAKLTASLLDFDRVVKRFINDDAERFYYDIEEEWGWNSRYWEQRALLCLDRYLIDRQDRYFFRREFRMHGLLIV